MLQITLTGRVIVDGCIVGGLHHLEPYWTFQSCKCANIIHSAETRDDVIAWLLDVIDDGILAL